MAYPAVRFELAEQHDERFRSWTAQDVGCEEAEPPPDRLVPRR